VALRPLLASRCSLGMPAGHRTRVSRGARALPQRRLQICRAFEFVQQIAKGLVGKLLKAFHRLAREEVERVPSLFIKPYELAPKLCWLLGHEKSPVALGTGDNIRIMRAYLIFGDLEGKLDALGV
jgi:hypothetical protein